MQAETELIDVFLQPGEYFVGDASYRIRTLLGSCVSITLWHPHERVGAMSHFLLPVRAAGDSDVRELDGRYGEEAMWLMVLQLQQMKLKAHDCIGKIFGGGDMFPGQSRKDAHNVGKKNGEAARSLLHAHNVQIGSESLFGVGHRQIIFDVHSGDVWARQNKLSDSSTIEPKEQAWPASK